MGETPKTTLLRFASHYVLDVTFGEDRSRIRILPLPQILALARNLAINLYRNAGFDMRSGETVCWRGSPATGCEAAKRRSCVAPEPSALWNCRTL